MWNTVGLFVIKTPVSTDITIFINVSKSYSCCCMDCGSVAEISCYVIVPSQRYWLWLASRVTVWWRGVRSASSDNDYCWMRGWLFGYPQCIAAAGAGVVAGLCADRNRNFLSLVVPDTRGTVTLQTGVVSSFLMVWPGYPILTRSILEESAEWVSAKPSQNSNWGETCTKRKSTSPCRLEIPAFHRVAGVYNRHLNSNRENAYANNLEIGPKALPDLAKV